MAWHDDHVFAVTTVVTRVASGPPDPAVDRFASRAPRSSRSAGRSSSRRPRRPARPAPGGDARDDEGDPALGPARRASPPASRKRVASVEAVEKQTRPPRRFTDATLLTAMETAGAALDDRELSEAMKERGLGTPATRAEIIETLLRRGYVERQGKALDATENGIRLVDLVPTPRQEPGPDRRVGGPARAHAPEGGRPAGLHGQDRGLRARAGRPDSRGDPRRPEGQKPCRPEGRTRRGRSAQPRARQEPTSDEDPRSHTGAGRFLVARQDRSSSE